MDTAIINSVFEITSIFPPEHNFELLIPQVIEVHSIFNNNIVFPWRE